MIKSIKWDKYEVALLIESTLNINLGIVTREDELKALSDTLRRRAKNLGVDFDDKFRNFNGMSLQVAAIESLIEPERAPRHCAKLFIEMTDLYKNDREKFNAILAVAHEQAE